MTTAALAVVALGLLIVTLKLMQKAGEAQARAEYEAVERERSERMAREMLKERSREDVARDLDDGAF